MNQGSFFRSPPSHPQLPNTNIYCFKVFDLCYSHYDTVFVVVLICFFDTDGEHFFIYLLAISLTLWTYLFIFLLIFLGCGETYLVVQDLLSALCIEINYWQFQGQTGVNLRQNKHFKIPELCDQNFFCFRIFGFEDTSGSVQNLLLPLYSGSLFVIFGKPAICSAGIWIEIRIQARVGQVQGKNPVLLSASTLHFLDGFSVFLVANTLYILDVSFLFFF